MNETSEKNHDIIKDMEELILKSMEGLNPIELARLIYNDKLSIPIDTKEELKDRVVRILQESKKTLSKDSISAIVSLEHINEGNIALMNLIKNRKIEAIYVEETDKPFNIDQFVFKRVK